MKQPRVIRKTELNHMSYGQRRVFAQTLALYRSACGYIGNVVLAHWDSLEALPSAKKRINAVEALIHKTTDNPRPGTPGFRQALLQVSVLSPESGDQLCHRTGFVLSDTPCRVGRGKARSYVCRKTVPEEAPAPFIRDECVRLCRPMRTALFWNISAA